MATKTVHNGNYGSYLYIDYYFTKDTSARTWKCFAALKLHVPSNYYFDPWINTGAHSATLQKNGGDGYSGGEHTLVSSKQVASGSYNDAGDAPSVNISWAWNVNSSWGGYVNPYGTANVTGERIDPATPGAPTSVSASAGHGSYVGVGDTITINWSGATGTITGYEIQRKTSGGSWVTQANVTSTSKTDSIAQTSYKAGNAVQYRVRAKNGNYASGWTYSNTLTVSGAMRIKQSNSWKTGTTWIKVNNSWKQAKRVWIKQSGTWRESK